MTVLLTSHLFIGAIAVIAGLIAFFAKKGSALHRYAGVIFAGAMVYTAGGGTLIAIDRPEALTGLVGLFTCYLVVSGLITVKPRGKWSTAIDRFILTSATLLVAAFVYSGLKAPSVSPQLGITPPVYFGFAAIAAMAAVDDFLSLCQGGLKRHWRITRHLWRMGFSLYIAAGSLLDGPGTKVFPEQLAGTLWMTAPVQLIGFLILFWLISTVFSRQINKLNLYLKQHIQQFRRQS
ncbi:hypothetical protein [Bowmanella denitrificans]|uniref:hypothetical protein n=1 Tax=Bowmanella denitrificans TaxID=366582 RepID=UPI0031D51755